MPTEPLVSEPCKMSRQRGEVSHSYEPPSTVGHSSSTDRHREPLTTFPRERRSHDQAPSPTRTYDSTDEDERSVRLYDEEAYSDEDQVYEDASHYEPSRSVVSRERFSDEADARSSARFRSQVDESPRRFDEPRQEFSR